jgi:hypothetical protein
MRWAQRLLLCFIALGTADAAAQDRLSVDGGVDVRWVSASGDLSFLNGGPGILRFDPEHEDIRLGRAFLAPKWRLTDILTLHAVIDAYGDHDRNAVDLSEFYMEVRPFPTGPVRWRARFGAFFMPVSLENRGIGWTDVYSITPSAVNTWLGEEFRTIGAELEARWLGASSGYLGDVALVAGAYGWNDPAGVLIAQNGFSLTDRPSTLFGLISTMRSTVSPATTADSFGGITTDWKCAHCATTTAATPAPRPRPACLLGGRGSRVWVPVSNRTRIGHSLRSTWTAIRLSAPTRPEAINSIWRSTPTLRLRASSGHESASPPDTTIFTLIS